MTERRIERVIQGIATSDGAGVKLKRSLGQSPYARLDPFLMLDEFYSEDPDDYIAGFPSHPHRGFETVTYMLEGHMLHEDHLGNRGDLTRGSVQWMTAGRGIVHSEMPQQREGTMRGFQLWINLPAAEKMKAAGYQDIPPEEMPEVRFAGGATVKVIAGRVDGPDGTAAGPIQGLTTDPYYLDVRIPADEQVTLTLPADHNAFVYVFEGETEIGGMKLSSGDAGLLSRGGELNLKAGDTPLAALVLAGKPIGEPVVQYGPFVMNTREEIEQALQDYQMGRLTG